MIGNTLVGTNDLAAAKRFYTALLEVVGAKPVMEFERMCAWAKAPGEPAFGVITPLDGAPATVGNGSMVSLQCDDRGQVDALHAKALELGGSDEGTPGARGPEGQFYAAYFRSPEGHKFLAYTRG